MRKRWTAILSLAALCVMIVLAGCTKSATPEELLNRALEASKELESYTFASEVKLNVELPESLLQEDPSTAMAAGFLSDITLSANGVYQEEPAKMEMTLDLKLGGDVGMTIRVPMIMEQDRMWVKVPNIPMLAGLIPQDMVGKYLELDFEELAAMDPQAEEVFSPEAMNVETQKQLGIDVMNVLMKHFDEEQYVEILNEEEAELPEDVEASDVLRLSVKQDQLEEAVNILVMDALPEIIDVLAKPEYAALLGDSFDAEEAKSELPTTDEEIQEGMDELKETLVINELSTLIALNEDGHTTYSDIQFDFAITQEGEEMLFNGSASSTMTNINGEPAFELEEPTEDNTVTISQLQEMFGAGMGF